MQNVQVKLRFSENNLIKNTLKTLETYLSFVLSIREQTVTYLVHNKSCT